MSEEKSDFGKRLKKYRKAKGLSQRELADILNMSFQSISKWENGNGFPNLSLIPKIADILDISCDKLIGYEEKLPPTKYNELYNKDKPFWGYIPNNLSYCVLKQYPPTEYKNVLELGCGEGRDSIFFGVNGYDVTGVDIAQIGLDKAKYLSSLRHIKANFVCSSIQYYTSKAQFDIICGYRILHYLLPEDRETVIEKYKAMTRVGGINVFTVCVEKPFVPLPPDHESSTHLYKSGELATFYSDWEILYMNEETVDCNSSGIPHKHVIDSIIARKII